MANQKTNEEFVANLLQKNPTITPLEPYVKSSQHILCRCNICGFEWKSQPNNLLHDHGCPACVIKKQTKNSDDFIKQLQEVSPNIEAVSQYIGARRYVSVRCKECGHEWEALPTNLLKGRNCPECKKRKIANKNTLSNDEFQELFFSLHPDIEILDIYQGYNKHIRYSCKKCGYTWRTSPACILFGHGCPRCAKNGVYSQEEFINKVSEINPQIEILGEYQRSNIPVLCRCKLCGNEWKCSPNNIFNGRGCPKCCHSTTSFMEEAIFHAILFAAQGETVIAKDHKTIGKELDIYIPEKKIAIEPGSWKWHKSIIDKDYNKRKLCAEKGIRIITIYTDYPGKEPPFSKDCYVYSETIGFEQDQPVLKEIVSTLLAICDIHYNYSENEWNEIIKIAYQNSRRRTTDEFVKIITEKLQTIRVEGEYTGAWNRIQTRCLKCGYVWSPIANNLLRGHGCPRCASIERGQNLRKTESVFLSEIALISPNINILSSYETNNTYIDCECKQCGYQWKSIPTNLAKGKGCPICSRVKNGIDKRKSPDKFLEQLKEKNPDVELLSIYTKLTSKIECRCKICNSQWSAKPASLLAGSGCRKCSYEKRAAQKQKKVVLIETGQIFDSIKIAADYIGTSDNNLSACLRGKTKTAKGMHWKYAEI